MNATPRVTVNRMKRLCKDRKIRSIRKVGAIVSLSKTTTWRMLRKEVSDDYVVNYEMI